MRLLFTLAALVAAAPAHAQQLDRRSRQDPELVVEPGGRLAYCDQMRFTPDGRWVLTVGDDKVVRMWECRDGKLNAASMRVLRWPIWREQRGAIYALATSSDPEGKRVAIGGLGALTTSAAVFDRDSGAILHFIVPEPNRDNGAIMAVAFNKAADRLALGAADGSIFVTDFKTTRVIGRHAPLGDGYNRVRLVHFLDEQHLLSVTQSAEASEWDLSAEPARRVSTWKLSDRWQVRVATISPDGKCLAAGHEGPLVAVRSVDGKQVNDVTLRDNEAPRSVAFDASSRTLVFSVGAVLPGGSYFMEGDDQIRFFDYAGGMKENAGLKHRGKAESLAFHPGGKLFAVAGGDDHEVTLWNLEKGDGPVSVMRGIGSCLWDVGLSRDGNVVGFRDHRNGKSIDPNDRGDGPWRTFHLGRRRLATDASFEPMRRLATVDGWRVEPVKDDKYAWQVVDKTGRVYPLEHTGAYEGVPRCWTFIEADRDNPVRLIIGHYWGLSVHELRPGQKPKRVRLCVGHQGEVTALGVSTEGDWLVSCSTDQTIAAWTLNNKWPSHPLLGAAFKVEDGRLRVTAVDAGGPLWEAGLLVGDEVDLFALGKDKVPGTAADWKRQLDLPTLGVPHYFEVLRGPKDNRQRVNILSTLRQRPLWRFFPTRDGEWVLWMWRNSYYDTSTRGDFAVGWHVNSPDILGTPKFYRAEQFRKLYQKRTVIDKLIQTRDVRAALRLLGDNPLPVRFDETEPPAVQIAVQRAENAWTAKLTVTPYGDSPDLLPKDAELWVNDYRLAVWPDFTQWKQVMIDKRRAFELTIPVNAADVRVGKNVMTFQTSNRLGGRAEASALIDNPRPAPARPDLWGTTVGINLYSKGFKPPTREIPGLPRDYKLIDLDSAVGDATALQKAWEGQKYFASTNVTLLTDAQAGRADILRALDVARLNAKADDLFVLSLSGHGLFREEDREDARRSAFIFCTPTFDANNPEESGISSEELYKRLAAIKCRKLVLLDACHSGEAASNPVRGLTPNGQGPIILAACDRNQQSFENKKLHHGLFTYALLEALGPKMAAADRNNDGVLDATELFAYVRARLPELLKEIDQPEFLQVPILFAPRSDAFPVARRE
jgi:WD40 repeat protein